MHPDRLTSKYTFSGHQTFPFRYAWLPKAAKTIAADPNVFSRDDAMVSFGVGKNMVASIRFWSHALRVAGVDAKQGKAYVTPLGDALFGENGWDPYLEFPGTLWLLHWQLAESAASASTWHLAFTKWNKDVFTRDDLVDWLVNIAQAARNKKVSRASLRRDADVFIRTYVASRPDPRRPLEDTFDCPLVELGLIRVLEDSLYEFVRGAKPTLPVEVLTYALIRYWDRSASEQETLAFDRVLYGPGSPGAAFKLSEPALVTVLESLPKWTGMRYDETAGLRLLLRDDRAKVPKPLDCLRMYYEELPAGAAA